MIYRRSDQSSREIFLNEGNVYYIELLHKEGKLVDFMCVGAKFPTLTTERPVSSRHLVMDSTGMKVGLKSINSIQYFNKNV